jgi:hypothetical protein
MRQKAQNKLMVDKTLNKGGLMLTEEGSAIAVKLFKKLARSAPVEKGKLRRKVKRPKISTWGDM